MWKGDDFSLSQKCFSGNYFGTLIPKPLSFGRLFFASFPVGIDCKAVEMQQGLHVPGVMNKHAETRIETMLFRQVF